MKKLTLLLIAALGLAACEKSENLCRDNYVDSFNTSVIEVKAIGASGDTTTKVLNANQAFNFNSCEYSSVLVKPSDKNGLIRVNGAIYEVQKGSEIDVLLLSKSL